MKCYECNGEALYITKFVNILMENHIVGKYVLKDVHYRVCEKCGGLLFPAETAMAADIEERRLINRYLEKFPISSFISAVEAAVLLDITKQALHKNNRIKNGFIFSINHSGRTEYLKKSVELYKITGDGRFPLFQSKEQEVFQPKSFNTEGQWKPFEAFYSALLTTEKISSFVVVNNELEDDAFKLCASSQKKENIYFVQ